MMYVWKHPALAAAGIAWIYAYVSFFLPGGGSGLMDSHKPLHLKTFAMILIMIIAGPLGNVLLGKGMKSVGSTSVASFSDLLHLIGRIFTTQYIWLGVASLLT